MTLYERVDRDVSPGSRESFEFRLLYAVCFMAMLVPAAIRWLDRWTGNKAGSARSIFGEAKTMASNCATSAFMGM